MKGLCETMSYKASLISFIVDVAETKPRLVDFSNSSRATLMSLRVLIFFSLLTDEKYNFSRSEFSKMISNCIDYIVKSA